MANVDLKSLDIKDSLNEDIWTEDKKLHPEVRRHLLKIAEDFYSDLDIPWAELEDVRITGSLANYNWSKYSDIDLHLVIDYSLVDENEDLVESYFKARKKLWNNKHDISIHGFDVEVFVEDAQGSVGAVSAGVYSVLLDDWINIPLHEKPKIDKSAIRQKSKVIMRLIDDLVVDKLQEDDYRGAIDSSERLSEKILNMRKCGLERGGEYSIENLTFKVLRRNGYIQKLFDTKLEAYDRMMTIE